MKKIMILATVFTVALASCQKESFKTNPEKSITKPSAFTMPTSEEEARSIIDMPAKIRRQQHDSVAKLENYLTTGRCNPNASLSIAWSVIWADAVRFTDHGRRCTRYRGTMTVMANKECFLPWEFAFIPGTPENNTENTLNAPAADTTQSKNQYAFSNEDGRFPDGQPTELSGHLFPDCSYGFNTIISGASRINGYFSDIKLKGAQVAIIDYAIILADDFTIHGGIPIPENAILGRYTCWFRGLRGKEKVNDPSSKWLELIGINTNNIVMGTSEPYDE